VPKMGPKHVEEEMGGSLTIVKIHTNRRRGQKGGRGGLVNKKGSQKKNKGWMSMRNI